MPTQLSLYHIVYKNTSMYISLYKSMSLIYSSCNQKNNNINMYDLIWAIKKKKKGKKKKKK